MNSDKQNNSDSKEKESVLMWPYRIQFLKHLADFANLLEFRDAFSGYRVQIQNFF